MLNTRIKIRPALFKHGCLGDSKNVDFVVHRAYFTLAFTKHAIKDIESGKLKSCEVLLKFKESLDLNIINFTSSIIDIDELIKSVWDQIYQHHKSMSRPTFDHMNTIYFNRKRMTPYHRNGLKEKVCL